MVDLRMDQSSSKNISGISWVLALLQVEALVLSCLNFLVLRLGSKELLEYPVVIASLFSPPVS